MPAAGGEKGLKLTIEAPGSLPVTSDERRVRQVVTNLTMNAVKFTDSGSVRVRVAEKGGRPSVTVRDTGQGIRPEDRGQLFKPFSQIRPEGEVLRDGTGLGLYLSQKIAVLLGGEVTVESEYGKGSTFVFALPSRR